MTFVDANVSWVLINERYDNNKSIISSHMEGEHKWTGVNKFMRWEVICCGEGGGRDVAHTSIGKWAIDLQLKGFLVCWYKYLINERYDNNKSIISISDETFTQKHN